MHYDWESLAAGVHRCRLPFCDVTVGVVLGRRGVLLVDTGTTLGEAAAIEADLGAFTGRQVTHIVLTHKHFDHVLGSSGFAGARIHCAPQVADYLSSGTDLLRSDALAHGADAEQVDRAIAGLRPPEHHVRHAVLDFGDRSVTLTHLGPGHTDADLVVVVPPAAHQPGPVVVFTGDLVEESGDPAIDSDSDVSAWPETLERLLAIGGPRACYVPGHGAVVDASFVRRQQVWLRARRGAAGP